MNQACRHARGLLPSRTLAQLSLPARLRPKLPQSNHVSYRPQSSDAAAVSPAPSQPSDRPPRVSARVFDFISAHPRLVFGSLATLLAAWIYHMVAAGRARDDVIHSLTRTAALDAVEVRSLSRRNAMPLAAFTRFMQQALRVNVGSHDVLLPLLRRCATGDAAVQVEALRPLACEYLITRGALYRALGGGGEPSAMAVPAPCVEGMDVSEARAAVQNFNSNMPVTPATPEGVTAAQVAHVAAPGGAARPTLLASRTVPLLELLCLYATVMGIRDETGENDGRATPGERLELLLRAAAAVRRGATELPPPVEELVQSDAAAQRGVDRDDVLELVRALGATWQIPARVRPYAAQTYPLPVFTVATAEQQVEAAEGEIKLAVEREKAGVPLTAPYSLAEAKRLFFSQSICAWNECRQAGQQQQQQSAVVVKKDETAGQAGAAASSSSDVAASGNVAAVSAGVVESVASSAGVVATPTAAKS